MAERGQVREGERNAGAVAILATAWRESSSISRPRLHLAGGPGRLCVVGRHEPDTHSRPRYRDRGRGRPDAVFRLFEGTTTSASMSDGRLAGADGVHQLRGRDAGRAPEAQGVLIK